MTVLVAVAGRILGLGRLGFTHADLARGWTAAVVAGIALRSAPATAQSCRGDCDGDGLVTVNELVTGVNIALEQLEVSACPSFDSNADGQVTVDEIITALGDAGNGCPIPVCTPPLCHNDEVFHCPDSCPGGCGTICATPTPTITPTPDCTAGPCPDLVPGAVNPFFPTPVGGCRMSVLEMPQYFMDVCVGNAGTAASGPFDVSVDHFDVFRVPGLHPTEYRCQRRSFRQTGQVLVDYAGEVRETNEANNSTNFSLAVPSYAPTCTAGVETTPTPTATMPGRSPTSCAGELCESSPKSTKTSTH